MSTIPLPEASIAPAPPPSTPSQKSFLVTWLLSLLVGYFGVDRFYLGKIGTGILKLVTFGGFGIWWLVDLIITLTGNARDKQGYLVADYQKYKLVALIVTAVVIVLGIVVGSGTAQRGGVEPVADGPAAPAAPAETWVEVATLTGTGNARSDAFPLSGDKIRISYTITDDPLLGAIYLEPEEKVDLDKEGAIPAVVPTKAGDGVEAVTSKAPGNYWLDVRIPGNWTVTVEQFRLPD